MLMGVAELLSTSLFPNMGQLKRKKVLRNGGINIAAPKARCILWISSVLPGKERVLEMYPVESL